MRTLAVLAVAGHALLVTPAIGNQQACVLGRKGMQLENPFCPNCNQDAEETPLRLLWDCDFAPSMLENLDAQQREGLINF